MEKGRAAAGRRERTERGGAQRTLGVRAGCARGCGRLSPCRWVSALLCLAIETSNPPAFGSAGALLDAGPGGASGPGGTDGPPGPGVALVELDAGASAAGRRVLGVEPVRPASRHDDDLMPAIDRLCRACGVGPAELGRIAVSIGPGGYTATRIAVTTAKLLAEAGGGFGRQSAGTGPELVGVPTAEALARRAVVSGPTDVAVAIAWKRTDAWVQRFAWAAGEPRATDRGALIPFARLAEALGGVAVLVADERLLAAANAGAEGGGEAGADRDVLPAGIEVQPPRFDPVAVAEASAGRAGIDPAALTPLYPREPEAVSKWRDLHGSAPGDG